LATGLVASVVVVVLTGLLVPRVVVVVVVVVVDVEVLVLVVVLGLLG